MSYSPDPGASKATRIIVAVLASGSTLRERLRAARLIWKDKA